MTQALPPGQRLRSDFPRFGLTPYATRFPRKVDSVELQVAGDVLAGAQLDDPLRDMERVEQTSDFHCVTTWSCGALRWSGVRFADFYRRHIVPRLDASHQPTVVLLRGQ